MQRRQVIKLFPEDEENRVKEVNELGEIEPPGEGQGLGWDRDQALSQSCQEPGYLNSIRVGRVVHRLADPVVFASEPVACGALK